MNIFIAYKFSWDDKDKLRDTLEKVSESMEKLGHGTFVHFRDIENWGEIKLEPKDIIERGLIEIKKSDTVLVVVTSLEKSEDMLLEVGFAKGLGKKIILAIKEGEQAVFLRELADVLVEFDTVERLVEMLPENV